MTFLFKKHVEFISFSICQIQVTVSLKGLCQLNNLPAFSASWAFILFPVNINSIAFDFPMALHSLCVPPAPRKYGNLSQKHILHILKQTYRSLQKRLKEDIHPSRFLASVILYMCYSFLSPQILDTLLQLNNLVFLPSKLVLCNQCTI